MFSPAVTTELSTSVVQHTTRLDLEGTAGTIVMQSDLMQPDFLAAANGHRMNDCGVVTSSIHADIAYTLGDFLLSKLIPKVKNHVRLNIAQLHVEKGLVLQADVKTPQLIQVTATTPDISSGIINLTWENLIPNGSVNGDANEWLSSWEPLNHLIVGRMETLDRLAAEGKANRFTGKMAYTLFASNLVDYAEKYRGM